LHGLKNEKINRLIKLSNIIDKKIDENLIKSIKLNIIKT